MKTPSPELLQPYKIQATVTKNTRLESNSISIWKQIVYGIEVYHIFLLGLWQSRFQLMNRWK